MRGNVARPLQPCIGRREPGSDFLGSIPAIEGESSQGERERERERGASGAWWAGCVTRTLCQVLASRHPPTLLPTTPLVPRSCERATPLPLPLWPSARRFIYRWTVEGYNYIGVIVTLEKRGGRGGFPLPGSSGPQFFTCSIPSYICLGWKTGNLRFGFF